jgi:hypothetical protein
LFLSIHGGSQKSDYLNFEIGKYVFVDQNKKEKKGDVKKKKENNDKKPEPTPEQETDMVVINTSDIEMIKVKPPKKAKICFIWTSLCTNMYVYLIYTDMCN